MIEPYFTPLSLEQEDELKSYYKVHHRKCWAFKKAYKKYKRLKFVGNSISLVTGSGGIIGVVASGGINLVTTSTAALLIKEFMEYQSLDIKVQNCLYAFQSYGHLLIMIKDAMRVGCFHRESLIIAMNCIDNYVTDNSPIADKYLKKNMMLNLTDAP